MTEHEHAEGFRLERVGTLGSLDVYRGDVYVGRIQHGVTDTWYARTPAQVKAGHLGGNWQEVGKSITDACWFLLAQQRKGTGQ